MAAAQLPRDPLQPPPTRLQPQHLRYVVRRLHHLPPWIGPRRAFRDSLLVHSLSPQLSKEGAIPRDAEGAIFHGARQFRWDTASAALAMALVGILIAHVAEAVLLFGRSWRAH